MLRFVDLLQNYAGTQITKKNKNEAQEDLAPQFSCADTTSRVSACFAALKLCIQRPPCELPPGKEFVVPVLILFALLTGRCQAQSIKECLTERVPKDPWSTTTAAFNSPLVLN